MYEKHEFEATEQDHVAYVRVVKLQDLPGEVQAQVEEHIPGQDHVFGVFTAEGETLALVKDRDAAFSLARQTQLDPVMVN